MTRIEFEENVTEWWELMNFCSDNGCEEFVENVVDDDYRDEYIDEMLVDMARNNSWRDMLDILNDYYNDGGYDYYIYDEYYGRYQGADEDDFRRYKDEVYQHAIEHGLFDDDEEDEEDSGVDPFKFPDDEEYDPLEDEDEELPEEDCSVIEMLASGVGCVASINDEAIRQAQEDDRVFMEFTNFGR